jgi:branched-chain amino acid transport system ATP-binding protein
VSAVAAVEAVPQRPLLEVRGLSARYGGIVAIRGAGFEVREGEIVALVGPNGGGKTTTLNVLMGLHRATEGSVLLDGIPISRASTDSIARRGVAMVPEGHSVVEGMTVLDNLRVGAFRLRLDPAEMRRSLDRVVELFPMLGDKLEHLAGTLSGGQKQMLLIGRALMARPRLLVLDEPSFGLAPIVVGNVFRSIASMRDQDGLTVLIAEQNARQVLRYADRAYVLYGGRVVGEGTGVELLQGERLHSVYLEGATIS